MNITTLLIVLAIGIGLYLISLYNFFQTAITRIKASIQEIGNQLKRQADLIPNLEASVKGYLKHEKGILDNLAEARKAIASASNSSDVGKQANAASMLGNLIPRLAVIVESNPELKASVNVTNLMAELRDTADKVMYSRRVLIDLTADYNVKVVTFPSNLVANLFKFKEQPGFQVANMQGATSISEAETKTPKVSL